MDIGCLLLELAEKNVAGRQDAQGGGKRELVAGSWLRSQARQGLDMRTQAPSVSPSLFDKILGDSDRLRAVASDRLMRTGALLEDSDAILLLCNPDGVVMQVSGAAHIRRQGERNNLQPGGHWSEKAIGTNAIGTALHLCKPVTISENEHYCAAIRHWACAAVPLRDPVDGRLLGAIDISGIPGAGFATAGAIVATLAQEIETALREADLNEQREVLELFLVDRLSQQTEAQMLLDRFGRPIWKSSAFARYAEEAGLSASAPFSKLAVEREGSAEHVATVLGDMLPGAGIDLIGAPDKTLGLVVTLHAHPVPFRSSDPLSEHGLTLRRIAELSPALAPLCASASRFYERAIALTLEGAPGTGKHTLAEALNAASGIARPLEWLDCSLLDAESLRSDLRDRTGILRRRARSGTLCLLEPQRTPQEAQPLVAEVLERLTRSGGVRMRFITLTSEPLTTAVTEGRLLQELQLRCSGAVIRLPGLCSRRDEIGALLRHFAREAAGPEGEPLRFTAAALEALRAYDWPGNLWEMRDLVDALETDCTGDQAGIVDIGDLPEKIGSAGGADNRRLRDHEKATILSAVAEAEGNLSRAARQLGIARSTLYLKLEQYGRKPVSGR